MSEQDLPPDRDRLDEALTEMVTAYTADAPPAPNANRILTERANRPRPDASEGRLLGPLLAGAFGIAVLVGGGLLLVNRGDDRSQVISADPVDGVTGSTVPAVDDERGGPGDDEVTDADDRQDNDGDEQDDGVEVDLGAVSGAEDAADLPATAPDTYWAIRSETFDLVQVETRTGRILANLGGWNLPADVGEGELIQALQRLDLSPDGSLFIDDCCEPAFGSIFQLAPDQPFDLEPRAQRTGLNPFVSPSGELVMYNFGPSLQIADADFAEFGDEGWPQLGSAESADGISYLPLAWIDDRTIAVRVFGPEVEQIRIYDLIDNASAEPNVTERREARRAVPERFNLAAATRSDGMLVLAGRRPNGDPLGLPGGGDLVAEVIDPTDGELIAEFDLPDLIFNLDYDGSGRFLLTSGDDGVVRWYGAGSSGVLADGLIDASWH